MSFKKLENKRKSANVKPLQQLLKILQFWECAVPYMGLHTYISLPSNSLTNIPVIVSHDYSVISLALNNIFALKNWAFDTYTLDRLILALVKGPVKRIERVKIAHSFLESVGGGGGVGLKNNDSKD